MHIDCECIHNILHATGFAVQGSAMCVVVVFLWLIAILALLLNRCASDDPDTSVGTHNFGVGAVRVCECASV